MITHDESLKSTGQECGGMTTPEHSRHAATGPLTASSAEIPARKTAEPESRAQRERRHLALSSSALLTNFARGLFFEKTQRECAGMLPGLGGDSEVSSKLLATLFCPSDSEPVALGLTTNGTGCSCLPRIPTPTASQFGCKDVPRMLARRERLKQQHKNGNGFGLTLGQWVAVRCYTPAASDWKGSTGKGSRRQTLAEQVAIHEGPNDGTTVYPHPEFVEAVMRFPITWSELPDSATPSTPTVPNG